MRGNPAWLIDPASVRPSINRGSSCPVRNTLFRGKLVNQLTLITAVSQLLSCLFLRSHAAPHQMTQMLSSGSMTDLKKVFLFCLVVALTDISIIQSCLKSLMRPRNEQNALLLLVLVYGMNSFSLHFLSLLIVSFHINTSPRKHLILIQLLYLSD